MTGRTVSLLDQTNTNAAYADAISTSNTTLGDEQLYLKGGEGSMAVINLFSDAGELETIRNSKWLINEANLVFHIDASAMAGSYEPQRIYLYDFTNNRPIMDYYTDASTGTTAKNGQIIFDGIIKKEAVTGGRGLTYKIRITDQIRGLIKNADSTNVKLGIVVAEDIIASSVVSSKFKTANSFISQAPKASVMSPLGTILYGGKSTVPEAKRVKLEIYYTKPN